MAAELTEEELDAARRRDVAERAETVDTLLRQNKYAEALLESLQNPPVGASDPDIKSENADIVFRALSAATKALDGKELTELVKGFAADDADTLTKYVYRGLSDPKGDSSALLKVQNMISSVRGLGTIQRTVMSRQTV